MFFDGFGTVQTAGRVGVAVGKRVEQKIGIRRDEFIVVFVTHAAPVEDMLQRADYSTYAIKRRGKNNYRFAASGSADLEPHAFNRTHIRRL